MKVHVCGKPGTRKPTVAQWIARRYGLFQADVTDGERLRSNVDLNVLCIHECDAEPVPFHEAVPYAILIPAMMDEWLEEARRPDAVLGPQLDRLMLDRFGLSKKDEQGVKR